MSLGDLLNLRDLAAFVDRDDKGHGSVTCLDLFRDDFLVCADHLFQLCKHAAELGRHRGKMVSETLLVRRTFQDLDPSEEPPPLDFPVPQVRNATFDQVVKLV